MMTPVPAAEMEKLLTDGVENLTLTEREAALLQSLCDLCRPGQGVNLPMFPRLRVRPDAPIMRVAPVFRTLSTDDEGAPAAPDHGICDYDDIEFDGSSVDEWVKTHPEFCPPRGDAPPLSQSPDTLVSSTGADYWDSVKRLVESFPATPTPDYEPDLAARCHAATHFIVRKYTP